MFDFHCHVLPYVDDGAKNFDMSLGMLKTAIEENTKYICATSHFIPGESELSMDAYNNKFDGLKHLAKNNGLQVSLLSGLEVYISPDLVNLYKSGKIWGLNNKQYMLIELPMENYPLYTENVFYELRLSGVMPILAHPERNLRVLDNIKLLTNLVEQGTFVQLNAGSLNGLYGKRVKEFSEELVKRNLVHLLGSDAHNDNNRPPLIRHAYDYIKSRNPILYNFILDCSSKVVKGEYIEPIPYKHISKKKNIFDFLKSNR